MDIYLIKVNNENSRTRCVIFSKLKKTPEQLYWLEDMKKYWRSFVSVSNFKKTLHLFLVFILELRELLLAEFTNRDQSTDK